MKVVLAGLGMVAGTHLLAIRDARPRLTLSGVLGRDPARADAFAQKAKTVLGYDVGVFPDARSFAAADADFAIIATPPDARQEIVRALAGNTRPILMEKPIERSLEVARDIVSLCDRAGIPLGIVFQHRARAASLQLKKAIGDGTLGRIATVDVRVPWWRDQSYYDVPGRGTYARDGGGVMISQAIHTLDLMLWLLGPVTCLQAVMHRTPLHRLEAEDLAGALFELESGAVGSLTATTAAYPGAAESITLQGTKAAAHLASGVLTLQHMDGRTESFGTAGGTGGGADPMAFTHAWHQSVLEDFARALKKGTEPLATGKSALMAHAVIDTMERAAKSGTRTKVSRI
ncbi:Gfo/Idh/MocA family protein [Roseobacter ponti]|uniref:Gfo/Idh/MocA family oxidoreductase n=1 Tax=Roseobacter ponti TaxID=1891787 RepID=A0A858SPM7_9RHOB|nr:Gfo/Idh/MocA family oxidoreductase [Roseobacter ponti]QJF49957.1 Gfo/Idh/MocA family oxidoreductase [Roseobacter ponti]